MKRERKKFPRYVKKQKGAQQMAPKGNDQSPEDQIAELYAIAGEPLPESLVPHNS